jgi:hypothetical protein
MLRKTVLLLGSRHGLHTAMDAVQEPLQRAVVLTADQLRSTCASRGPAEGTSTGVNVRHWI